MIRSLFVALLLASTGCIPYGYVLPKYTYIPSQSPHLSSPDDVLAFRVETIEEQSGTAMMYRNAAVKTPKNIRLALLEKEQDEKVIPSQTKWSLSTGYSFWPWLEKSKTERLSVRIYRRGYSTLELETWPVLTPQGWLPAQSPEEREAAIDAIWGYRASDWQDYWIGESMPKVHTLGSEYHFSGRSLEPIKKLIAEYEHLKSEHTDTRTEQIKQLVTRLDRKIEFLKSQLLALENQARKR